MIETDVTQLEEPEDIEALIIRDKVNSKLFDYEGTLICAGEAPDSKNHKIMVTSATNIAYFLSPGHISVEEGKIIQKKECHRYERGGEWKLFDLIDERLFD